MRALLPLAVLLVIIALVLSALAGLTSLSTLLPWSPSASANCKLGPLRISIEAFHRGNTLVIKYVIQPPNPCYRVISVVLRHVEQADSEVTATIEIGASGPGPGKVCIQVLPVPITGEIRINTTTAPSIARINLALVLGLDNGAVRKHNCSITLRFGG